MKPNINLHDGESMLFECRPKSALIAYLFLTRYIRHIILLTIVVVIALSDATQSIIENAVLAHALSAITAFVLISFLGILWSATMVHKHWYFFTNERCIVYAGFWGINKKIVPYNRVIDVDMNRNPLRAMLGMSAVYLGQQGMGTGRRANLSIIDGLSDEMAEKISDLVSQHMTA